MLNIGDKLYRIAILGKMLEYQVLGVHMYETSTLYHVKCVSCTHYGDACELTLVESPTKGVYTFVNMLNNNCEDDDQSYWHTCENSTDKYYAKKEKALQRYLRVLMQDKNKDIEKYTALLETKRKEYERIKNDYDNYTNILNLEKEME